jgi:hypothetical protein
MTPPGGMTHFFAGKCLVAGTECKLAVPTQTLKPVPFRKTYLRHAVLVSPIFNGRLKPAFPVMRSWMTEEIFGLFLFLQAAVHDHGVDCSVRVDVDPGGQCCGGAVVAAG